MLRSFSVLFAFLALITPALSESLSTSPMAGPHPVPSLRAPIPIDPGDRLPNVRRAHLLQDLLGGKACGNIVRDVKSTPLRLSGLSVYEGTNLDEPYLAERCGLSRFIGLSPQKLRRP